MRITDADYPVLRSTSHHEMTWNRIPLRQGAGKARLSFLDTEWVLWHSAVRVSPDNVSTHVHKRHFATLAFCSTQKRHLAPTKKCVENSAKIWSDSYNRPVWVPTKRAPRGHFHESSNPCQSQRKRVRQYYSWDSRRLLGTCHGDSAGRQDLIASSAKS